jgi:hypothetical protein
MLSNQRPASSHPTFLMRPKAGTCANHALWWQISWPLAQFTYLLKGQNMSHKKVVEKLLGEPLAGLYSAYVRYPVVTYAFEAMEQALVIGKVDRSPRGIAIVGGSGVGKTSMIEQFVAQHPAHETPDGTVIPVFAAEVPKPSTVKGLVTTLLDALGVLDADRGNTVYQTHRLFRLLEGCRVEMLILDEFQHLIDNKNDRVIHEVADFIKGLMNKTRISLVLVGMPAMMNIFAERNQSQLRSRFNRVIHLKPFNWAADSGASYRQFLKQIEKALPFPSPSNLADAERAFRLYAATKGLIRPTMTVIKASARAAVKGRLQNIDDATLKDAISTELAGFDESFINPFSMSLEEVEEIAFQVPPSTPRESHRVGRRGPKRSEK